MVARAAPGSGMVLAATAVAERGSIHVRSLSETTCVSVVPAGTTPTASARPTPLLDGARSALAAPQRRLLSLRQNGCSRDGQG